MNDHGGPSAAPDDPAERPVAAAPKVDGRAPSLPGAAPADPRPRPRPAAPPTPARIPRPIPSSAAPAPVVPAPAAAAPAPVAEPAPEPAPAPEVAAEPEPVMATVAAPVEAAPAEGAPVGAAPAPARPRPAVPALDPPPAIGESLRRDPLPEEATGGRRRGMLPTPPQPPFIEDSSDDPYRWKVLLPSSLFRKVQIRFGDDSIEVAGKQVALDDIADVRFKLEVEAALVRKAASARMTTTFALTDGSSVRVSARNAASSRRATAIVETLTYIWTLLGDTAGADQRATLIGKVERGQEVQVGRLRLTSIGVAWKRNPIARWSQLDDPYREGLDVVIPLRGGDPIVVPLTDDDAYMLPTLVPSLRRRFG